MQTTFIKPPYAAEIIYSATTHFALHFPGKHTTNLVAVIQA